MLASRRTSVFLCIVSSAICAAAALRSGLTAPLARPDVLLVFEYDGLFDWEAVRVGDAWTTSAINWIRDLADRLTQSSVNPAGQDLMIPRQWWIPESVERLRLVNGWRQDISLRSIIEGQMSEESSIIMLPKPLLVIYQLTMLPGGPRTANLHVTLARTFWHAVEATAEAEQLVHKSTVDAEAELVVPITGYIVILPENYMVVHGQETWQGAFVSHKYQDHSLWSNDFLVEMLQYFFMMAKAISIPQLDEFAWRMDKVEIFHIYKEKYQQDQEQGIAPIPSQIVHPPVPAQVLDDLCFSTKYLQPEDQPAIAHEHVHATALALLHAAHTLESDPDAQQIQQHSQVESGSKRKYFVKRNYAGLAKHVTSFVLTNECSWQEDQSLAPNLQHNATVCQHDFQAMLHDAQELYAAAERVVRQSCQQDWLLQPYIFDIQEYRVFLIGGADARVHNEVVPVFMPTTFVQDQMLANNVTLPKGYFSARGTGTQQAQPARLQELYPNGSQGQVYFEEYFPYPIWKDEEMHALLVDAALSAANAIATSGKPVRTGKHVMLRMDLILMTSDSKVKFYVNEAHYFNDAVLMMNIWSLPASPPQAQKHGQRDAKKSRAYTLQLEQENLQAGTQHQDSSFVFPDQCDVVMDPDRDIAHVKLVDDTFGLKGSRLRPVNTAINTSAPGLVSTVQMPSVPADSNGLLLAGRLWQEVLTVAADYVNTK